MAELSYWQAILRAHDEEMARDPLVFAMGEDIGVAGGTYKATTGLYAKYGEKRVIDTPISENSYTGIGVGAAMLGCRPIVEIMSVNFAWLAMDQLMNNAAKIHYMSGGRIRCPLVLRLPGGTAHQLGAQHSARMEKVFMGVPGLRVVTPSSPRDAYGLLKSAVRCDDPVVVIEHEAMYNLKGEVPDEEYFTALEGVEVVRPGKDLTLFAYNISVHWALAAADKLAKELGIAAEVVDLRALKPLDRAGIAASVRKTHRAIVVEEDEAPVGVGAEVIAILNEECFFELDAAPVRVHARDVPTPYNRRLEKASIPNADDVVAAARKLLGR
ncbi:MULTISPECIES: alpha-ketoacid dehydrogenase subunit beta [Acidithiobacillus]|jgi:pyruvate dehydrogenase E1 component beta subunit|uniref:Pyruvate dehydrogenase E1 component beta subunit n=3 Tax=Acidithiobacillus caldus TaxID=33059 RepID=F9ZTC8_ACICS|nr:MULTISPECIES: alpha-ketoacid dehydrogenase subunit beta [Acidithiobacillus]AEK56930.1 Pyruvate dehydrogenase E1 component beta subunit [Acidithiobacillus caldus SM-1]AIA54197.1 Pyruvate dehydrogenase E1 component beta subunit [Acidithiobacillus caldus ATCC 51756]AUW31727.1 alpha-ketoacid dehydrogenase subunit beta [Acidithiobacillus caldus]MBU2728849.1 alpha-ketoacid dehydrogenase subunit beta [Acidithiobacillus caldus]MBU2736901.1 alpha-ketoacid dehydrogenase subunit beta [Acidithiobacillu